MRINQKVLFCFGLRRGPCLALSSNQGRKEGEGRREGGGGASKPRLTPLARLPACSLRSRRQSRLSQASRVYFKWPIAALLTDAAVLLILCNTLRYSITADRIADTCRYVLVGRKNGACLLPVPPRYSQLRAAPSKE